MKQKSFPYMKTKIEIIQSLLDESKITAQEAMTLMEKEKEYIYFPSYPSVPYNPYPLYPFYGSTTTGEVLFTSN